MWQADHALPAVDHNGSQLVGVLSGGGSIDDIQDCHSVQNNSVLVPVDHLELGHSVGLTRLRENTER